MSRSNGDERKGQHAARFGPAMSESEYQKAVQTLTLTVAICEHGNSQTVTWRRIQVETKLDTNWKP